MATVTELVQTPGKTEFEYTPAMYEEDCKFSIWFCNNKWNVDNNLMEDLVAELVIALYKARPKYDINLGSWGTFAYNICKNCVYSLYYNQRSIFNHKLNTISVDGDDKLKTSLYDKIGKEDYYDSINDKLFIKNVICKAVENLKRKSDKKFAKTWFVKYLQCKNAKAVAEQAGVTRQYVSYVIKNIRENIRRYLKQENYL